MSAKSSVIVALVGSSTLEYWRTIALISGYAIDAAKDAVHLR
jgi:hypothetical protein